VTSELLVGITVVGPDITLADAYATAAFAMGAAGAVWATQQPGSSVFAIDRDSMAHDAALERLLIINDQADDA
jgi:thiamine biosynthesis lipoprotein ApbE